MIGLDIRFEMRGWSTDGVLVVQDPWSDHSEWAIAATVPRSVAQELDIGAPVDLAVTYGSKTSRGSGYVDDVEPLVATARIHISGTGELAPWPLGS